MIPIHIIPEIVAHSQWNDYVTTVVYLKQTAEERKTFSHELDKFLTLPVSSPYTSEPFHVKFEHSLIRKRLSNGSQIIISHLNPYGVRGLAINRMYLPTAENKKETKLINEILESVYPVLSASGSLIRY